MSAESMISREQRGAIAQYLAERLASPVSIETWTQKESMLVRTDRDPCTFCDQVAASARQLASLHPLISFTPYDLDRHADRAREAGIERLPVTVVRGRNGRAVRFVGLWSGLLLPAFVDIVIFAGAGGAPVKEETRAVLAALEADLELELLVTPYDQHSALTLRIAAAFAIESSRIKLEVIEVSEFPRLAEIRMVSEVPVLTLNGRRYPGAWDEGDLLEQLRRIATGDAEPVIREHLLSSPYLNVEQAEQLAARGAQGLPPQPGQPGGPPVTPGGLVIPGR